MATAPGSQPVSWLSPATLRVRLAARAEAGRAEPTGKGDGRVYRISFTVSDGLGGTCSGTVTVGVPHDQGKGSTPIDSAPPSYDSFGP